MIFSISLSEKLIEFNLVSVSKLHVPDNIVGKGGHTPPFLDQPTFSKIPPV